MEKEEQQELIRLWNELRKTRGHARKGIRTRILEKFRSEPMPTWPPEEIEQTAAAIGPLSAFSRS